jgi:hypothetical protein
VLIFWYRERQLPGRLPLTGAKATNEVSSVCPQSSKACAIHSLASYLIRDSSGELFDVCCVALLAKEFRIHLENFGAKLSFGKCG